MKLSGNIVALLATTGVANAALFPRCTFKVIPITTLVGSIINPALAIKPDFENRLPSGAVTSKVDSSFETSLARHSRHLESLVGSWKQIGPEIDGEDQYDR